MTTYDSLQSIAGHPLTALPVDNEVKLARELLAEIADLNIYDHGHMVGAATGLMLRLRSLVDAVTAERGAGK
ncbi:hypothetical protein FNH09_40495 [Streptomyces adustus]|uniref:Uncharacterized protein n=1 Tax=Streptomyces adustus TaxID=1609272 RepID=A0A5N8VRH9_9ACTN|nr:hypothetical protein [Streptomyces adustus]MPY37266.1 hypothetical protein [Streptomyces adustus]